MQIQEIKQRLDGSRQVFYCDALRVEDDVAVLKFVSTMDYSTDPSVSLPHRYSEGYFWRGRPYLMYKMFGEADHLLGYRFDVCTDVQISPTAIRWTDLVLDYWVDPLTMEGKFMDEEELAEAMARGLLKPEHLQELEKARASLLHDYRAIIAEADALRARVGSRA